MEELFRFSIVHSLSKMIPKIAPVAQPALASNISKAIPFQTLLGNAVKKGNWRTFEEEAGQFLMFKAQVCCQLRRLDYLLNQ